MENTDRLFMGYLLTVFGKDLYWEGDGKMFVLSWFEIYLFIYLFIFIGKEY
jgi:hypothetical protein